MGEDDFKVVAVDLGGTHLRVAVVDQQGNVSDRRYQPTPRDAPHPDLLVKLVREVVSDSGATRAVVGVPGPVDYRMGNLRWAPNLPSSWLDGLAEAPLSDAAGVAVALANDADLAAVGEAYFGAGKDSDDVVYMTISTGIGAGVVLGHRLVHGRRSLAEVGHTVIDRAAWAAELPATLELLGSGTAMGRLASEAGLEVDGAGLRSMVNAGNPGAVEIWNSVVAAACIGVRNLVELFAPSLVVIGGGVGLSEGFVEEIAHRLSVAPAAGTIGTPPELVTAALGDDAGLSGAGAWHLAFRPEVAGRQV